MGRINEYQRNRLASQVVGVPEPSRAGQMIGQAVGQFGETLKRRELQQRQESTNLQANLALMEFAPSLQRTMYHLQREKADNPRDFQGKLFEDGTALIKEYEKGIANNDVRSQFSQNAHNLLKQQVLASGSWVEAKDQENAEIAAGESVREAVISFGLTRSPEELLMAKKDFNDFVQEEIPEDIRERISPDEILKKFMPKALESHFANRVMFDADNLVEDLRGGKYNDVPGVTAKLRDRYLKEGMTAQRREQARINRAQTDNFEMAFMDLNRNRLSTTAINDLYTAKNPIDGISLSHARRLEHALVNKIESDASQLSRDVPAAGEYIDLVYKVFDKEERVARAEVLEKLVDVWRDGIVSTEESEFLAEMSRDFKSVQSRKQWQTYTDNLEDIRRWADRVYGPEDAVIPQARMIRDFLRTALTGADIYTSKAEVLRQEAIRRALEFNPMMSTYEDPVEQSYRHQAIQAIKMRGKEVTESRIKSIESQLRAMDEKE